MYFRITCFLLSIFYGNIVNSQQLDWAISLGGTSDDRSFGIVHDSKGNIYTAGFYSSTVDFDASATNSFNLTSMGSSDIFVTKYDPNGNFLWARSFSGSGQNRALRIKVDDHGNVYTTGSFTGITDFNPGFASNTLTAVGSNANIFVSKLDSSGNFVWAKGFTGNGDSRGLDIFIDEHLNVFTTGFFRGNFDFDPGAATFSLNSGINQAVFISKLDSLGNFVLAKMFNGSGNAVGYGIVTDSFSNIYTTGFFERTVDFNPTFGTTNLSSSGSRDVFVSKLDSMGNFLWAKKIGAQNSDIARSLKMGLNGDLFVVGYFSGTVDFDPNAGFFNLSSNGQDVFVLKLSNSGAFKWAKSFGGNGTDFAYEFDYDFEENIYIVGDFTASSDFDPGIAQYNISAVGGRDIYINKLDSSGNFLWAGAFGGNLDGVGVSISVDEAKNILCAGAFNGTFDFDPGVDSLIKTSNGSYDIFNIKLFTCDNSIDTQSISICSGDTLFFNNKHYFQSGNFLDTLSSIKGCDSIVNTDLKVVEIDISYDTSVSSASPNLLRANQSAALYQWLDCSNNAFLPIQGATNQDYLITATGNYAVEITFSGCVDTSNCINKLLVGIEEQAISNRFLVYPNPSSDVLNIELPIEGKFEIYNIKGQLLASYFFNSGKQTISTTHFAQGVYFVEYTVNELKSIKKLVISR